MVAFLAGVVVIVVLIFAGIAFGSRGGSRRDGNEAAGGYYDSYGDGRDHGHHGHHGHDADGGGWFDGGGGDGGGDGGGGGGD